MLSKYEKHCMQTVAFVKEQHERWLKFDKGAGGKFLEPSRWHPICPHFQNQFLSSSDLISSSKESRNGLKGTCAGRPTSIRILDMIHLMDFRGCIVIWASQLARRRQGDPNGDKNRLKADAF